VEVRKAIITYAEGAHEELLDVALPTYRKFAEIHGYDLCVTRDHASDLPPAWNKVPLLLDALRHYQEVVWFDCDLVVVDASEDFPPLYPDRDKSLGGGIHSLVRHFESCSEVPNSGVWRVTPLVIPLLQQMMTLEVFRDHGWWEQAALMTLMGYTVPPQGSDFRDTHCRCVQPTKWSKNCQWMRLCWNSHPNYRADKPRIVHCSYRDMQQRLEVMRALVRDPGYDYPRYDVSEDEGEE
jgi:hypothetical protein